MNICKKSTQIKLPQNTEFKFLKYLRMFRILGEEYLRDV